MTTAQEPVESKQIRLDDIAEIKTIKLHEVRAEDLLVTSKFHGAWSRGAGSENTDATFLTGLLDGCPRFLDLLYLPDDSQREGLDRQHLDILQDADAQHAENKSDDGWKPPANEAVRADCAKRFLLRKILVVRLHEDEKRDKRFLPGYVLKEVEKNLPGMLDDSRPDVTFDPGCNIPTRTTPPTADLLGACPIQDIPLDAQIDIEGSGVKTVHEAIDKIDSHYRLINSILALLAANPIQVSALLAACRVVSSPFLPSQPGWPFMQELGRRLASLAEANKGLQNSLGKSAVEIIAAHEGLERFLIEQGPWGEGRNRLSLFERIVVTRLALALPEQCNVWTAIDASEKRREAEIRADERLSITRSIFHHLKNLVAAAVIDPLELIRRQGLDKKGIIDKALRGANLLREIINAMNLASSGKPEDFLADLQEPDENAFTLGVIVETSLRAAFANMFDAKYFNKYHFVYFPKSEPERLHEAKEIFGNIPTGDIAQLLDFGRNFLIKNIHWSGPKSILDIKIGNSHNSALKLIVLFQELFLNAVKYVTPVEADTRRLEIALQPGPKGVEVTVFNSYDSDPWKQPGDTLIGKSIIDDFMNQLGFFPLSGNEQPGLRHFIIPLPKEAGHYERI